AGHILVLVLAATFVALGFWQLHRNQEKHDKVAAARAAYAAPAPPLTGATAPTDGARAQVTGTYDPAHEVLLRNQVHDGDIGNDVVTPLRQADGTAVLVDRGWFPTPIAERADHPAPPSETVVVRGLVHPARALSGPDAARTVGGRLSVPRVDLTRIGAAV